MMGQTYEKLGEKDKAVEYYRKASTAISHNPASAYAVPFAKKSWVTTGHRFMSFESNRGLLHITCVAQTAARTAAQSVPSKRKPSTRSCNSRKSDIRRGLVAWRFRSIVVIAL